MSAPVRTRRKNAFNLFKEAGKLASFDEFPMLRPEVDPQLLLSNNTVDQPFHLICEKDTVLAHSSGKHRVEFADGPVRFFDLDRGDFVYVPGGMAHRILTLSPGIMFRYKAREPGGETVLWYCGNCNAELDRFDWNATDNPAQQGYQLACERFNAEPQRRLCSSCGTEHPPVDLSAFRWSAVAEKLLETEDED